MHNLDGSLSFFESETLSSKCFLVDQRVEIGKASTELDLFAIERDTAVSALSKLLIPWCSADILDLVFCEDFMRSAE